MEGRPGQGRGWVSYLRVPGSRAIVAAMRAPRFKCAATVAGARLLLLAASFTSSLALADPVAPPGAAPASPPAEPAPAAPPPEPAPATLAPPQPSASAPATRVIEAAPNVATEPPDVDSPSGFARDFRALPLSLEARLGFNARLGSSFDDATQEERWGASYAFAAYLAWRPEFALGLELDHSGLGRVRALSGQTSIDNEYTATGAWIGARAFPIRGERLDFFVNLRIGLVLQHVNALGTRGDTIERPAQSFSCSEWDGPGFGLGGALGLAYRLGRHVAFVSRLDLSGARLSGESLGTCADGIGSVASLSGSVGLAFEFETAPK